MSFITAALIVTGGTLLSSKIASNRQKDPKAAIGSGTAPTLQPGDGGGFTPVAGSELKDFGEFDYENMAEGESMNMQDQLVAYLMSQGIDPSELGILNAAGGGPLYKSNGGGIGSLLANQAELEKLKEMITKMSDRPTITETVDFSAIAEPDLGDVMVDQLKVDAADLVPEIPVPEIPLEQVPTGMFENAKIGLENFAEANPQLFNAGIGALGQVLTALLIDMPEAPGSMVRTQTLPGNATRRRNQLQNISPIGGSTVDFAADGKVLQRPMFMPNGGPMNGPGGPKDDLIPVMASNGEYMLSKAAVDAAGGGSHAKGVAVLDKFNEMGNKRYGV